MEFLKISSWKKSFKKTRTSFWFFYQFWEHMHKDMKLLYGLVVILTKYFPLFLPNIIIPTFTSQHNWIWSTGEQIFGSNMTYQIFSFKHAFCMLFLLITEEKVEIVMFGSKSGKKFWNYQKLHIEASYPCEFVLKTDKRTKNLFLFFLSFFSRWNIQKFHAYVDVFLKCECFMLMREH